MSVNLHLSITVRGYDRSRVEALKQAIQEIIEAEQLEDDLAPLSEKGKGKTRCLFTQSNPDMPVIISGSYRWVPEVQKALSLAAKKANGGPCEAVFEIADADEDLEDLDDDDLDDENKQPAKSKPSAKSATKASAKSSSKIAATMGKRYFEFVEGSSSKFWEISTEGSTVTTRWGRLGTDGQSKTKTFKDTPAAKKEYEKLVAEKTNKGYMEK